MIIRNRRTAIAIPSAILCFALGLATAGAASLAGSEGEVRRKQFFPKSATGGCQNGYKQYVAARGHSAYASTPSGWGNEYYVCGWSLNAKSKKSAEEAALKGCNSGLKKYKVGMIQGCEIAASK